jgi:GTPase SAR1 family protein
MTDVPKKIILVGDVGVGKTSLILNYTEGACDPNTLTTVSFDFKPKQITVGKKTHTLHIIS